MVLQSNQRKLVFCQIRKTYVIATPEELVRQSLLQHLIKNLGAPSSLIAVEKPLKDMPHLEGDVSKLPDRRFDIVCYKNQLNEKLCLAPLLIIECKSGPIREDAINQVLGYNHYVKAPYIALASEKGLKFVNVQKEFKCSNSIPHYQDMCF